MVLVESKTSVHWLTFSVKQTFDEVQDILSGGWGRVEKTGAYGQPQRIVHETGTAIYFGSKRADQPVVVNLPGEVCESWASEGLKWCQDLGGKVTRLDVANDVGPDDVARSRLWELVKLWKRGKVDTKMRPTSHRMFTSENPGEGHTAYFGGKTADLQLRAYDKRGPLRLEWQWRPPEAHAGSVASVTLSRGAEAVWRHLAEAARWPLPWWKQLTTGEGIEAPKAQDEPTKLMDAVNALAIQYKLTLWSFQQLGLDLNSLLVQADDPDHREKLRGDQVAKLLKWADEADEMGYADGSGLRDAVRRRMKKSRKVRA